MKPARVGRLLSGQFTMNGPYAVGSVTGCTAFFLGAVWGGVGRCGLWLIRNWRSRQDLDEVPKFFGDVVGVCDGLSYFGLHGIAKTAP